MQTFLPHKDFYKSAKELDKKRCWNQVKETKQILNVIDKLEQDCNNKIGWKNHPAVKMWIEYKEYLKLYFNVFLYVSKNKHNINTKYIPYDINNSNLVSPWWLGDEQFHRAMRARLIEKDSVFYSKFYKDKGFNGGKYLWPDNKTKTFKII